MLACGSRPSGEADCCLPQKGSSEQRQQTLDCAYKLPRLLHGLVGFRESSTEALECVDGAACRADVFLWVLGGLGQLSDFREDFGAGAFWHLHVDIDAGLEFLEQLPHGWIDLHGALFGGL